MKYEHGQRVLAIDPGVKYLGWAHAVCGVIVQCGYLAGVVNAKGFAGMADVCIIEKPQQYAISKARRKDVTDLTLSAGEIKAYVSAPNTLLWEPREWKGQVPKKIHQARILAAMKPAETAILPVRKTEQGHVIDACGLVLRYLGRL